MAAPLSSRTLHLDPRTEPPRGRAFRICWSWERSSGNPGKLTSDARSDDAKESKLGDAFDVVRDVVGTIRTIAASGGADVGG
mmetsp:Transcript_26394/g.56136  ORF Transcript_26394/g.56136 Transcript_26394/m.56136 type:complete len:82 (-) Transcript_26394:204-449(-)